MLDERPVRAEKEQADVVESDGAISVVAVVLQPVDGETFELLPVQVLCRKRVGVPVGCDGYKNEGLSVLRHDAHGRVDVVCPGFASDCLETIEEINDEARRAFEESAANGRFEYIEALNDCDDAVALYARLTLEALGRKA